MSWRDWDEKTLPGPLPAGSSLEEAKRRIDEFGYVVLDRLLPQIEVEKLLGRLADQAAGEVAAGNAYLHDPSHGNRLKESSDWANTARDPHFGTEQFVSTLFNKGQEFWSPLLNETIQALVAHVLGAEFLLYTFTGSILHPGAPLMGLHTDQWYINQPVPRGGKGQKSGDVTRIKPKPELSSDPDEKINAAYAVQSIFMLTDFTEQNGATRIVPKSHLSGVVPESVSPHPYPTVPAEGAAGSVLLYDARLWHSAGEHKGSAVRYALHGTFSSPQIRTQENYALSLLPEIRRQLPRRLLELCGFKTWWSLGVIDDFRAKMVDPDAPRVGRLEAPIDIRATGS